MLKMKFSSHLQRWLVTVTMFLSAFAFNLPAMAQGNRTIRGTVKDALGNPLTSATVSVKGTAIAVTTDNVGNYTITFPATNKTLVASYVGLEDLSANLTNAPVLNFKLSTGNAALNDVVVIGYGSNEKPVW